MAKMASTCFDLDELITVSGLSQVYTISGLSKDMSDMSDHSKANVLPVIVSSLLPQWEESSQPPKKKIKQSKSSSNRNSPIPTKLPAKLPAKLPPIPREEDSIAFLDSFDSEFSYKLSGHQKEEIQRYIQLMRGGQSRYYKTFREKAVKTYLALKLLVDTADKKEECLKSIRLDWESYLPPTNEKERPMAAAITMLCSGATNDKRLLPALQTRIFDSVDYSAMNIRAQGKNWVCSHLEECGVGKQNICASYIYGLAQSVMVNNGLERDYRRLKHLNGFGPKTALITIQAAYGLTQGIGVDVHVARILGALEWSVYKLTVMAPNQEEEIWACAEAILSPRDWVSVNILVVPWGSYSEMRKLLNDS
jgi:endonuclease III